AKTAETAYHFNVKTRSQSTNFAGIPTFLYNDGPVTSLTDANLLVKQTYEVQRNGDDISDALPARPVNVGPRSTPNYAATAAMAVKTLRDGTKVFPGQRDDPLLVDLRSS